MDSTIRIWYLSKIKATQSLSMWVPEGILAIELLFYIFKEDKVQIELRNLLEIQSDTNIFLLPNKY